MQVNLTSVVRFADREDYGHVLKARAFLNWNINESARFMHGAHIKRIPPFFEAQGKSSNNASWSGRSRRYGQTSTDWKQHLFF